MTELSLNVSRTIKAPIESVYGAWLNPDMLAKFMLPGEGTHVAKAETDAVVGGRFDIIMVGDGKEMPHGGIYKVLDPYSRIEFTWESPFSVEGSMVTISLKEMNGGTHIELIHIKFPDEESRSNHEHGWAAILACLDEVLI